MVQTTAVDINEKDEMLKRLSREHLQGKMDSYLTNQSSLEAERRSKTETETPIDGGGGGGMRKTSRQAT